MTSARSGSGQRRVVGVVMALAIGLAVVIAVQQGSPRLSAPTAETSPVPVTSSPTLPPSPATHASETESPETGQTPVQPPATVPPIPKPAQPETTTPPPTAPVPLPLRGVDLTVIPGAGRVVALAFDAGAKLSGPSENPVNTEAAGADPHPFFRFPYGERDARTIGAMNDLGYVAVRWTVDTLGRKGTRGGINTQSITERVLASLQPGEIVLMHVGSNPEDGSILDADALPQLIDRISAAGYGFATLDELLGG